MTFFERKVFVVPKGDNSEDNGENDVEDCGAPDGETEHDGQVDSLKQLQHSLLDGRLRLKIVQLGLTFIIFVY